MRMGRVIYLTKGIMYITGFRILRIKGYNIWLPHPDTFVKNLVLRLIPRCFIVRLFDCDTARYFGSFPVLIWNSWHGNRVMSRFDAHSDGPCKFEPISFREYFRLYYERRIRKGVSK